jgi:competence protein ComEC
VITAIIPAAASAFAMLLNACVSYVFIAAEWVSAFPFATVYLSERWMIVWFVCVYSVIGIMFFFRKNGMYRPVIPIIVAVLSLFIIAEAVEKSNETGMTVSAIDVGQGQCIAVLDGKTTLVIDCGGVYNSGEIAARWLLSNGRKQVDALILSHFDEDHVNGVNELMHQVPVKKIIYCGNNISEEDLHWFNEIHETANKFKAELHLVNTSTEEKWGAIYACLLAVDGENDNDGLITFLRSGNHTTLIMGDADFAAESQLLRSPWLTKVDCLVVGHHGSAYSTGDDLLESITPEIAIISCGFNSYGHPSEEVLDRLVKKNVVIYRTDQIGTIEIKVR